MNDLSGTKELYRLALDNDWEAMKNYLSKSKDIDSMTLLNPISEHKDNIIHFVVHSGRKDLFDKILDSCSGLLDNLLSTVNFYGNTVLHEAVISGNLETVKLLVQKNGDLLEIKNNDGETPLFRAAAFGKTKIVKFLASQRGQIVKSLASQPGKMVKQLIDVHRKREDGASVLFAAVQGKHFGTALELLDLDDKLTESENGNRTSLHMLAKIPSALKGDFQMRIWKKLFCFCLPVGCGHNDDADNIEIEDEDFTNQIDTNDDANNIDIEFEDITNRIDDGDVALGLQSEGLSVGRKSTGEDKKYGVLRKVSYKIYLSIWKLINRGCPLAWKIWKEKREQQFANQLALNLIRRDLTWEKSIVRVAETFRAVENREEAKRRIPLFAAKTEGNAETVEYLLELDPQALDLINDRKPPELEKEECGTPLFTAIRRGNVEFVKLIIQEYPQALERINHKGQNILHMIAIYRQREIFNIVKRKRILMNRLARQIDIQGYTVLHSLADTVYHTKGTRSGPAYQLQEELEWFSSVKEIVPSYYVMLPNKNNMIAEEIFEEKHKEQLNNAKTWTKETSQACSAVAIVFATVVFAATFTVPDDEKGGHQDFVQSTFFLLFTVMVVISLSCSLAAILSFLLIFTSPFELEDFRTSVPRRLTFGFALLFMSVATTLLSFTAMIFRLIHKLDEPRQWMVTLVCFVAFLPVNMLALSNYPLFASFARAFEEIFKLLWKVIFSNLIPDLKKKTKV